MLNTPGPSLVIEAFVDFCCPFSKKLFTTVYALMPSLAGGGKVDLLLQKPYGIQSVPETEYSQSVPVPETDCIPYGTVAPTPGPQHNIRGRCQHSTVPYRYFSGARSLRLYSLTTKGQEIYSFGPTLFSTTQVMTLTNKNTCTDTLFIITMDMCSLSSCGSHVGINTCCRKAQQSFGVA